MWIERTQEEIPTGKSRDTSRRREGAIVFGIGMFLVLIFFLGDADPRWPGFRPWGEMIQIMPTTVFFSVWLGCFYFLTERRRTVICPLCENAKYDDGVADCPCGGRFVDLVSMKWVDESPGAVRRRVSPSGHWVDESGRSNHAGLCPPSERTPLQLPSNPGPARICYGIFLVVAGWIFAAAGIPAIHNGTVAWWYRTAPVYGLQSVAAGVVLILGGIYCAVWRPKSPKNS
jgi:hypothetical protein